ncbi:uncharacterized protein LOC133183972 [Saccostrea echinata]|uniref:uncharacterized protein LOC133183972 n=1 Tax=Saccostrea echinata TaxID=191078 RepID=UPI002A801240|nr:uncharacterized protein LOC133183972 [Saccostrea echinata]
MLRICVYIFFVFVVFGVQGLLHPGGTGPTIEERFEALEKELRGNITTLQQQMFASETLALRQILTLERTFRKELELEMEELQANFSAQEMLLVQERQLRLDLEREMNKTLQNISNVLQISKSRIDNVVAEQEAKGKLLGVSMTNTSIFRSAIQQQVNQISASLSNTQNHLKTLNASIQSASTSSRTGDGTVVAFTAYASSSKDYNTEKIVFNSVITNYGGAYNSGTGIFTSPTDGVYAFTWTHLTHYGRYCHSYLTKDGTRLNLDAHSNLQGLSSTVYTMATMTGTLHLSKGDEVWIQTQHCEGFLGSPYNSFSGWKL